MSDVNATVSKLRKVREREHMSQGAIAERIGVSWVTISRWENGWVTPSPLALKRIQSVLRSMNGGRKIKRGKAHA